MKTASKDVIVPILAGLDQQPGLMFAHGELSLTQVAVRVLVSGDLVSWPSPCGFNCSYSVKFLGPAYECKDIGPLASVPVNFTELSHQGYNEGVQPLMFSGGD